MTRTLLLHLTSTSLLLIFYLLSFLIRGSWGSEEWSQIMKDAELANCRARISTQSGMPPAPLHTDCCVLLPCGGSGSCCSDRLDLESRLKTHPFYWVFHTVCREMQISYIKTWMWNQEKWYRWAYSQSRNREQACGHRRGKGAWGELGQYH